MLLFGSAHLKGYPLLSIKLYQKRENQTKFKGILKNTPENNSFK